MTRNVYRSVMSERWRQKFSNKPLFFAPMEGITDEPYRLALQKIYPEWDYFSTDFLRVPNQGHFTEKKLIQHFGQTAYASDVHRQKTSYQILTTLKAKTSETIQKIWGLGFEHLDLNIGCPSKTVNGHFGGAYLLTDPEQLKLLVREIRANFPGLFTVKMRLGFHDTNNFIELVKVLEGEGAEAITIHGRTRDQLYKGRADWSFIKQAVEISSVPIVGNGDVWTVEDVENIFSQTGCAAVMCGRGALKTPWLAQLYKKYQHKTGQLNEAYLLAERSKFVEEYFERLELEYRRSDLPEENILKRFKSFSRNLFDDYDSFETVRSRFLRANSLREFQDHLSELP